jgi:hypothetical protein
MLGCERVVHNENGFLPSWGAKLVFIWRDSIDDGPPSCEYLDKSSARNSSIVVKSEFFMRLLVYSSFLRRVPIEKLWWLERWDKQKRVQLGGQRDRHASFPPLSFLRKRQHTSSPCPCACKTPLIIFGQLAHYSEITYGIISMETTRSLLFNYFSWLSSQSHWICGLPPSSGIENN